MTKETASKQRDNPAAHLAEHQFKPGQSGNPAGRPKGARSKLSETFLKDALEAWEDNGKTALKAMADEKPNEFAKMIAGILPKEHTGEDGAPLFPVTGVTLTGKDGRSS